MVKSSRKGAGESAPARAGAASPQHKWGEPIPWQEIPSAVRKVLRRAPRDQWPQVEAYLAKYPETAELARLARTLEFVLDAAPQRFVGLIYGKALRSRQCDAAFRKVRDSIHALRHAMLEIADLAGLKLKGQQTSKPTRRKRYGGGPTAGGSGASGGAKKSVPVTSPGAKRDLPISPSGAIILSDSKEGAPPAPAGGRAAGGSEPDKYVSLERIHEVLAASEGPADASGNGRRTQQ